MHAAAMVGVLGFLGGFMPLIRGYSKSGTVDFAKSAVQSGVLMVVVCLLFTVACVKSFIDARKARAAATSPPLAT
jgi:di/tricarboxylate transporter